MTSQLLPRVSDSTKRKISPSMLIKAIFDSPSPEQVIRSMGAQELYLIARDQGLPAATEILMAATTEQVQIALDFDLWEGDKLNEENLWEWLSLADDDAGLEILQKILNSIDLKLVAVIINRYVDTLTFEETTDNPPGEGWTTPDNGRTWIQIKNLDGTRYFYLARFLALIFETNADLFYQTLAIPGVATETILEEESYQDKERRLSGEGVPDFDSAYEITAGISLPELLESWETSTSFTGINISVRSELLSSTSREIDPLWNAMRESSRREELEAELTLLINAAVIRWKVLPYEKEAVSLIASQVAGATAIGLEALILALGDKLSGKILDTINLTPLFRHGISVLGEISKKASKISLDRLKDLDSDSDEFRIIAGLRTQPPTLFNITSKEVEPFKSKTEVLNAIQLVQNYL